MAVAAAASAREPVVAPESGRDGGEEQPAARRRAVVAKAGMRARLSLLRVRKVSPGGWGAEHRDHGDRRGNRLPAGNKP
ncbi:hypothetical protein GCM10010350_00390 [Streptomyces galilaeus]|nr:hypothetical protein GCM10010350_00390 [Streptomyces galilaeus]